MSSITAEEFGLLAKYIHSICGVALDSTKTYLIETRLKSMMQQYACASFMDLYNKVKADRSGNMEKEVVNAITTNETLFFRDASPFELFKHKILPDLIDVRSKANPGRPVPIRIWSAACSTGQEVYSIAIALREALGNLNNFQISILGTDISDEAVTRASYGKYNKFEIERGLPAQTLNRYFTLMGDGWKIKDEIRAMAVFKKFNLMKPFTGLGRFDVVFCRNVAIYFTPMDKKLVFEKIAGVLEPDGSLVIGSTESLTGVTEAFEARRYMRAIFYQPAGAPAGRFIAGAQPPSPTFVPRPVPTTLPAPPAVPARPMGPPRAATVAAPVAPRPAPTPPTPAMAPRPEPPRPPAPAAHVAVASAAMTAETFLEPETGTLAESAPAAPRRAPVRTQPVQVYRAGDKSDLKRLLMQKKQKASS
ncbi:CheR family methyltransferase [Desulfomicrobium salsuginis]